MQQDAALRIVNDALLQPYEEKSFLNLVHNLFGEVEARDRLRTGSRVYDAFEEHIASCKYLVKYTDPDSEELNVLAVKLRDARSLERARTMQRNFAAQYLSRKEFCDTALVAYYADDAPDWRLSLVRLEYRTVQDEETGRVKPEKDLTPARRYSFLVGDSEPSHTARKQLVPLVEHEAPPTLGELDEAFDIEVVTQDFFDDYKEHFLAIKEDLDDLTARRPPIAQAFAERGIDTATFAKKLLGQIVFLYFLQKKGWLGVPRAEDGRFKSWGSGPKDFLRRLFERAFTDYDNFFNDCLEPLFYEALATDRGERAYYSRFDCRIPFLNGGLFEPVNGYPWDALDIPLGDDLFKGVLDTFDRYNFTVREDEPLEKEVAVDPEMLGKVFENLLDVQDRKSKGAFYTPREIVHYMCQETLIDYLAGALTTTRPRPLARADAPQADAFRGTPPTQGTLATDEEHTAVPREDLATLVRAGEHVVENDRRVEREGRETDTYSYQLPDSIRENAHAIDAALAAIKICDPAIGSGAFPVGMMQAVVRARQTLSTYLADDDERTAYRFKRHAIQHSLYGVDLDGSAVDIARLRLWLSLVVDEDDFTRIQPLPNLRYRIVQGDALSSVERDVFNNEAEDRLHTLIEEHIGTSNPRRKKELQDEIDALITDLTGGGDRFDFHIYFREVFEENGGFDVVIGNPPYFNVETFGAGSEYVKYLKGNYSEIWMDKSDILFYFLHRSINISKGIVAFVLSNAFLFADKAKKLRSYIINHAPISKIANFEQYQVFESASISSAVAFFKKNRGNKIAEAIVFEEKEYDAEDLRLTLNNEENFFEVEFERGSVFALVPRKIKLLNDKIDGAHRKLDSLIEVGSGMQTGANKVYSFKKPPAQFPEGLTKKRATTTNIERYRITQAKTYLLYVEDFDSFGEIPSPVQEYLLSHRDKLANRADKKRRNTSTWWNYTFPMHKEYYHLDKLWCSYRGKENCFAYDATNEHIGLTNTTVIFDTNPALSLKYILALLNSKLLTFRYRSIGKQTGGGMFEYFANGIGKLPIPRVERDTQQPFIDAIDEILSMYAQQQAGSGANGQAGLQAQIAEADRAIDRLVYRLYGLTDEEIAMVEAAA